MIMQLAAAVHDDVEAQLSSTAARQSTTGTAQFYGHTGSSITFDDEAAQFEAAAVHKGVENEYGKMVLERPSPQLMGEFNNDGAARAQTLDPHRERLTPVGVMLLIESDSDSQQSSSSKQTRDAS